MKEIKESLKHNYNIAVRCFNDKDYTSFFRNIIPSIELLYKVLIFDVIGDENLAWDIIDGNQSFYKTSCIEYGLRGVNNGHRPSGKNLPLLFSKAFFYKHKDVYNPIDTSKSRLIRGIEGCSSEMARFYDIANRLSGHADKNSMTPSIQAETFVTFLLGYIDFLKSNNILTNETTSFLQKLDKFNIDEDDSKEEKQYAIKKAIKKLEHIESSLY